MFRRIHKFALSLVAATLLSASPAYAGSYSMSTYGETYGGRPDEWVTDIVTEEFTQKFPYQKYTIVVVVNNMQLGEDTVCYARAGISAKAKRELNERVPSRVFFAMQNLRNRGLLRSPEKQDCIKLVVRTAVQDLMDEDVEKLAKDSAKSLVD